MTITVLNASRAKQMDTVINAPTTSTFTLPQGTVLVVASVGAHWINIGSNPVLNTLTNYCVPAGGSAEFSCSAGDKIVAACHIAGGHLSIAY
jgi:putative hemolysin